MATDVEIYGPMPDDTRNVRTDLDLGQCIRLRELAESRGISIEEALRRATSDWIDRHDAIAEDDPLFAFHDRYEVPTSGPTDPESIESALYDSIEDETRVPSTR